MALNRKPGCCCTNPMFNCGGCQIPQNDLTVSWPGDPSGWPGGSAILTFTQLSMFSAQWNSGCIVLLNNVSSNYGCFTFGMSCAAGSLSLNLSGALGFSLPCDCSTLTGTCGFTILSKTCGASFILTANIDPTSCSGAGTPFSGFGTFTFS